MKNLLLIIITLLSLSLWLPSYAQTFTQDSFHCADYVVTLDELSQIDRDVMVSIVVDMQDELAARYPDEKYPYYPFEFSKGYHAISEHKAFNDSSTNHWYLVQVSIDKNLNRTYTYHFNQSSSPLHWKNSRRYNLELGYNIDYHLTDLKKNSVINSKSFQLQTTYVGFRYKILEHYWLGFAFRSGNLNDKNTSLLIDEFKNEHYTSGALMLMRELNYENIELFPYLGIYSVTGEGSSLRFPSYYKKPVAYFYGRGAAIGLNINYRINRYFSVGTSITSYMGSRDDHIFDREYPYPSVTYSPKFDAILFNSFNISFTR